MITNWSLSLFIRIGGFHNVMSFMGAVGTLMADSGLTDMWETVYTPNTAAQMEMGHDYARALHAHILSAAAVMKHIIDALPESKEINHEIIVMQLKKLISDNCVSLQWKDFTEIPSNQR